jgi:hypothetical protein
MTATVWSESMRAVFKMTFVDGFKNHPYNFQMFGTYTVQQGLFKMVIQDVIHKDFQMQQGGTINFAGDPYEADLDLKAVYTVPSVATQVFCLERQIFD